MPMTAKGICNLGLSKLGSQRISSISSPTTSLEKHCNEGYPQWRDEELAARTWNFALRVNHVLTLIDTLADDIQRKYVYSLPNDFFRIIREPSDTWLLAENGIYSFYDKLTINYVFRVDESKFDVLFIGVLSWRIAQECVEKVTQSTVNNEMIERGYNRAIKAAASVNAFQQQPRRIETPDEEDEWIAARMGMPSRW
jgi:hypothetical protein